MIFARSYPSGEGNVEVLKGITLSIAAGEMVAIVGASGSGKSTLMNILGCLDKPTSGTYRVAATDVARLNGDELARLRREHFGFIFQRYHLLSHLTAAQNVEVPAVYAGAERKARLARAHELLIRLGLGDRAEYQPSQLSGGQQQRVSIARALMNGGEVILADEPTGALDSRSGEEVMGILHQLKAQGHTVIIVTHDPQVAAQAERVIEIHDGEIVRNPPALGSAHGGVLRQRGAAEPSAWRQFSSGFREALVMAWRAMAANKMRTLLTMLGIIIGIASVVSIVVVGDAAKQMVLADIRAIVPIPLMFIPARISAMTIPAISSLSSTMICWLFRNSPGSARRPRRYQKACVCGRIILTLPPAPRAWGRSILTSTA
ncbi:macrolide export ATP-binding/permease MacB [Klebsiella grimontii]|uniref:Macrolide export ATP-binding/permease MacB n=1 Tax=Klebsiella grimontii TaxID=2058152 RepID=A0A7H4P730_9ENTR|nr:macrolide export ATP-binding/permease MacB [Klebsiella grimontii]